MRFPAARSCCSLRRVPPRRGAAPRGVRSAPVRGGALGLAAACAWAAAAACAADAPIAAPADFQPYRQTLPGSEVGFDLVPVAGGVLRLRPAPGAGVAEEGSDVVIRLAPFWMGRCEVRWAEYRQYMDLCQAFERFDDAGLRQLADKHGADAITAPSQLYDPSFTYAPGDGPDHPAVSMSQYAAKQYAKWLSLTTGLFYRLPTDAEWEYACRAGSDAAYSFGDEPAQLAEAGWYDDNSDDATHPAGEKLPNAWGLYDMHGNACEWVLDAYRPDWYPQFRGRTISGEEAICWPDRLYPRVLRGGSWRLDAADCRSDARRPSDDDAWRSYDPNSPQSPWWFASDEAQDVGFRLVRPVEPPPRDDWPRYWDADLPAIQQVVDQRIDKEGRGRRGLADSGLPAAVRRLEAPATTAP